MNKYTIIAVMGQSGAGKDSFAKAFEKRFPSCNPIITCTTRPIRDYEQNGVDYHFLTNDEFSQKLILNNMVEATVFNEWCYGTSFDHLLKDRINVGVFNPTAVEILKENRQINLITIYITASDKVRLLRQLNREENPDCDEIVRRYTADQKDFSATHINFIHPDFVVRNNGEYSIEEVVDDFLNKYTDGINCQLAVNGIGLNYMLGKND